MPCSHVPGVWYAVASSYWRRTLSSRGAPALGGATNDNGVVRHSITWSVAHSQDRAAEMAEPAVWLVAGARKRVVAQHQAARVRNLADLAAGRQVAERAARAVGFAQMPATERADTAAGDHMAARPLAWVAAAPEGDIAAREPSGAPGQERIELTFPGRPQKSGRAAAYPQAWDAAMGRPIARRLAHPKGAPGRPEIP
jgi:hypothetical protein